MAIRRTKTTAIINNAKAVQRLKGEVNDILRLITNGNDDINNTLVDLSSRINALSGTVSNLSKSVDERFKSSNERTSVLENEMIELNQEVDGLNTAFTNLVNTVTNHNDNKEIHTTKEERELLTTTVEKLAVAANDIVNINRVVTSHVNNKDIHIIKDERVKWNSGVALAESNLQAITSLKNELLSTNTKLTAHASNDVIHVTKEDKTNWNNKTTLDVTLDEIAKDSRKQKEYIDNADNTITKDLSNHTKNLDAHVSYADRKTWDTSVSPEQLDVRTEAIKEAASKDAQAKVDIQAGKEEVNNLKLSTGIAGNTSSIARVESNLATHTSDKESHVSPTDRVKWDRNGETIEGIQELIVENAKQAKVYTDAGDAAINTKLGFYAKSTDVQTSIKSSEEKVKLAASLDAQAKVKVLDDKMVRAIATTDGKVKDNEVSITENAVASKTYTDGKVSTLNIAVTRELALKASTEAVKDLVTLTEARIKIDMIAADDKVKEDINIRIKAIKDDLNTFDGKNERQLIEATNNLKAIITSTREELLTKIKDESEKNKTKIANNTNEISIIHSKINSLNETIAAIGDVHLRIKSAIDTNNLEVIPNLVKLHATPIVESLETKMNAYNAVFSAKTHAELNDQIEELRGAGDLKERLRTITDLAKAIDSDPNFAETIRAEITAATAPIAGLSAHVKNTDIHVTTSDKTVWSSKVDKLLLETEIKKLDKVLKDYMKELIDNLVGSDPKNPISSALDTLKELATALGNDPNFATTVTTMIDAIKKDLAAHTDNGNIHVQEGEREKWNEISSIEGNILTAVNRVNDIIYSQLSTILGAEINSESKVEVVNSLNKVNQILGDITDVKTYIVSEINRLATPIATFNTHAENKDIHVNATERTKWNATVSLTDFNKKVLEMEEVSKKIKATVEDLKTSVKADIAQAKTEAITASTENAKKYTDDKIATVTQSIGEVSEELSKAATSVELEGAVDLLKAAYVEGDNTVKTDTIRYIDGEIAKVILDGSGVPLITQDKWDEVMTNESELDYVAIFNQKSVSGAKLFAIRQGGSSYEVSIEKDKFNITDVTSGKVESIISSDVIENTLLSPLRNTVDGLVAHSTDKIVHVTAAERTTWNAKETPANSQIKADKALADSKEFTTSAINGIELMTTISYSDWLALLNGEDTSDFFVFVTAEESDQVPLIAVRHNNKIRTITLSTSGVPTIGNGINGSEIVSVDTLNAEVTPIKTGLTSHVASKIVHITAAERTTWNDKETTSGSQSKVDTLSSRIDGSLSTLDSNLTSKINQADSKAEAAISSIENHMNIASQHVSTTDRKNWNEKETPANAQVKADKALTDAKEYVDSKIGDMPVTDATFIGTGISETTVLSVSKYVIAGKIVNYSLFGEIKLITENANNPKANKLNMLVAKIDVDNFFSDIAVNDPLFFTAGSKGSVDNNGFAILWELSLNNKGEIRLVSTTGNYTTFDQVITVNGLTLSTKKKSI